MTLRNRVLLVLGLIAVVLLVGAGFSRYFFVQNARLEQAMVQRWEPARAEAAEVLLGLIDQEAAERGFLITGQEELLTPYYTGGERADSALRALNVLLAGDPVAAAAIRRASDRIAAWRQLGAIYEIEAQRAGREAEVRELVAAGTSHRLFEEARMEIEDLRQTIISRLGEQRAELTDLQGLISALRLSTTACALALILLCVHLVRKIPVSG